MQQLIRKTKSVFLNGLIRNYKFSQQQNDREQMEYDVIIVGGGPAGLSTAIKLKQLQKQHNKEISVCILEKGSQIGANILSGNCFDPTYFQQLFPDYKTMENGPPLKQLVNQDKVLFLLNQQNHIQMPQDLILNAHNNHGNYIISLSDLCKWMGEQAQELGVDIYSGFAAKDIIYNDLGEVKGVLSNEFGISKDNKKKENYQDSIELLGRQTVLAEGCRGSISLKVMSKYGLDSKSDPMSFGLGLKEVWEVNQESHFPGLVQHSVGWPLESSTYGGSFMYHQLENNKRLVHLGLVVGLDYKNPYLNPYEEFQRFKTHPAISQYLQNGQCISYGARALNEGSFFSLPDLVFPGGLIVGCAASMLNVLKIKGSHYAIGSGILAANNIYQHLILQNNTHTNQIHQYQQDFNNSQIYQELYQQRNFKNAFKKGFYFGLINAAFIDQISKGKEPWNFRNSSKDHTSFQNKKLFQPIQYPKHDGKLTFDLLDNLARSNTNHESDQPSHLVVKPEYQKSVQKSFNEFDGPEQRFCPANVYEFITEINMKTQEEETKLQINAQNCLHCKTCSIKMVDEYIQWNVPEGGGGPNYTHM